MTSSSRLASNNHEDQPMDVNQDQANDTTYSQKHTTLIKEEQHHSSLCRSKSTVGGASSYHNSRHHHHHHQQQQQQQTEAPVEIYRDPSPDAADSFQDHHHNHQQQNTMDSDYGDQENIRPHRARDAIVGDLRAQSIRGQADSKASSSCSSSSSHSALQRRPSAKTELLERSRPQGTRPSTSSVDAHQQQAQSRNAPAPLVKKRSHYAIDEDSSAKELYETREQLKQTHVGKSVAAPTRVDAPKKQRREAAPGAGGQQQQNGGGQQTTRQRGGGASSSKQGEEELTEEELKEVERKRRQYLRQYVEDVSYGSTYEDAAYEYRNVILPKAMFQWLPRHFFVNLETAGYTLKLLSEPQWRAIGLQMSPGWEHYMQHAPEPHIMPFRRDLETSRRVRREQQMAAAASGKGKKEEDDVKIKAERP